MHQEEIVICARARSRSCRRARRLLRRRGYAFEEVDVCDDGLRVGLIEDTGRETLPLVFLGGRLVGGLGEIQALEHSGAWTAWYVAGCRRQRFVWEHATERSNANVG